MTPKLRLVGSEPAKLEVVRTFRSLDNPNDVVVRFNRPLTAGELSFFHDMNDRAACLMEGQQP